MPLAARIGDQGSGHGCFPPHMIITGIPKVIIQGMPAATLSDMLMPHICGLLVHPGNIANGSSKVMISGKPAARIGDMVSCGSIIMTGASKVVIGG